MGDKTIGSIIKERREALGMSLQKVGEYIGCNRSTLCRWENGETKGIKRSHIYRLSEILVLPVEMLLTANCDMEVEDSEVVIARNKVIDSLKEVKSKQELEQVYKFITLFLK